MPFTGPNDPTLPPNVKKLTVALRRKWIVTWNRVFGTTDDEGRAFAAANATVKEMEVMDSLIKTLQTRLEALPEGDDQRPQLESAIKSLEDVWADDAGEKDCGGVVQVEVYKPLGGATTFAGVDAYREGQHEESVLADQVFDFKSVFRNIWEADDLEVAEKSRLTEQASQELSRRIANPPEQKSLKDKVLGVLFGEKATTKTEGGIAYKASDFADVPDAGKPSTWKLRMAEGTSGNFTAGQLARAITALQPGGFRGNPVELGGSKSTVTGRIDSAIGKIKGGDDDGKKRLRDRLAKVKELEIIPASLSLTKDAAGEWRWLAVFSNRYQDRENEIFPGEAHKEYEAWVDATGVYPELRLWHVPGSRIGVTDLIAYDEDTGFMLGSGVFDKGMEDVAERLAADEGLTVSHGYRYIRDEQEEGVYAAYRTHEISVLPSDPPSNPWTAFTAQDMVKEVRMQDKKRAFLEGKLGKERYQRVETHLKGLGKELEDGGVAMKDILEVNYFTGEDSKPASADAVPAGEAKPEGQAAPAADAAPAGEAKPGSGEEKKEDKAGDSPQPSGLEQLRLVIESAIDAKVSPLAEAIGAMQSEVKELKRTSDDVVADALTPRTNPAATAAGVRGSASDKNVMDPKEGQKATEDQEGAVGGAVAPYVSMLNGQKVAPLGE